jgi:ribosome-binding protein aMBF1 (putative translation factor)
MSNARLECSAEGTGPAISDSAYQVVRVRNPSLSLPQGIAKEALRKTLGANVRRERTDRRISQEGLASRCGLNPRTIAKIEAGEIGIRPETLDRIERAIGCTFNNGAIEKPKLKGRERRR